MVRDITVMGQTITASMMTMGRSTVMVFWVSMGEAFTGAGITADLAGAVFKVVVSMAVASAAAVAPFMVVVAFMAGLVIIDRQECKSRIAM